jgi:hypothetical protein
MLPYTVFLLAALFLSSSCKAGGMDPLVPDAPSPLDCLPDGACAAQDEIVYVDADRGVDDAACTKPSPCKRISTGLATGRSNLWIRGTFDEAITVDGRVDGRIVSIQAEPGQATLTLSGGGGAVLTAKNGASVSVYGVAIAGAHITGTAGISSQASTLSLSHVTISHMPGTAVLVDGGSITLTQSMIAYNTGGGVSVIGSTGFVIVGNTFIGNGHVRLPFGAINIATTQSAANRMEFNSFFKDVAQDGVGSAIACDAGKFVARNNVIYANGSATSTLQVSGSCSHEYTVTGPVTPLPGIGNQFVTSPIFSDPAYDDLHLMPGCPGLHAADPGTDLRGVAERDLDGTIRKQRASDGAYETPAAASTPTPCPAQATSAAGS